MRKLLFLVTLLLSLCSQYSMATGMSVTDSHGGQSLNERLMHDPAGVIDNKIRENFVFYGLASYYNNINYYIVSDGDIQDISDESNYILGQEQFLAIAGRHRVLILKAPGLQLQLDAGVLSFDNPKVLMSPVTDIRIVDKDRLSYIFPDLDKIRYAHLWALSRAFEACRVYTRIYSEIYSF